MEVTRDVQTESVVFTVTGVRNLHIAQYWSVECTWSAKTVDTESVVAAVFWSPFLVVDDARWNHFAIDVGDHVSTHNHCYVLFVECVHHSGEGVFVFVHVVAIELNDKLTSLFVVSSEVPVATDTHIVVVSDDVDQAWVVSKFVDCFTSTVG